MGRAGPAGRGRLLTAVLSLASASAGLFACADSPVEVPVQVSPPVDHVTPTTDRPPDPEARYVAVLVPLQAVDVTCKESGDLTSVKFRPGDAVAAEQVVAELDLAAIVESLTIARAELRSAQALLEQYDVDIAAAERALEIENDMLKRGIGVQKHVEEARFALQRARKRKDGAVAAVAEQRARIAQLQRRQRESAIKAPFAGVVSLRYRDPGTAVTAGEAIVRLIRVDTLLVRFAVPPTDVGHVHVGDTVQVEIELSGMSLPATVMNVSPELDPAAQLIFVEAELPVPETLQGKLPAGLPAWVRHDGV